MNKTVLGVAVALAALMAIVPAFAANVACSLGKGVKPTFHEGVVYRHPGMVPLLEVSGDHYEMGLQYGVLLRQEIPDAVEPHQRIMKIGVA